MSVKIGRAEFGIGQRVHGEAETVAVHAHSPGHLFHRAQIHALVMLYTHRGEAAPGMSLPRHVACGAAHAAACRGLAADLRHPELIVGGILVGQAVIVGMALEAGFYRSAAGIAVMRGVAGGASEAQVSGFFLHGQAGLARLHRGQPLGYPHAMQPCEKSFVLLLVAVGAGVHAGAVLPRILRTMAGRAVDGGGGVSGGGPFIEDPGGSGAADGQMTIMLGRGEGHRGRGGNGGIWGRSALRQDGV